MLMSCFNPLLAVDYGVNPDTSKHVVKILPRRVDFNLKKYREKYGSSLLLLPCGHCLGCLKDYRSSWAVRILLEASLYEKNCFITLTYSPDKLPKDNKPHREEIVKFFKRLRASGVECRYFYCGEKGFKNPTGDETGGRAHYHAIIFGYDFEDKELLKMSPSGCLIYRSRILEKLWPFGLSSIGDVDAGSACYVAMYANKKKLTGENDGSFVGMSRMPGLGIDKFNLNWFKSDTIYCALGEATIPRFYHKVLEGLKPEFYEEWKKNRLRRASQKVGDQYVHGLCEEEALLYNEEIEVDKFIRKLGGSVND